MASVVLLRGANVGGRKTFRSRDVVEALADLDASSVGAAGTFVVRGRTTAAALAARVAAALPFEADVIVRPAAEVADLVRDAPFPALPEGAKAFVTVLAAAPKAPPAFPLDRPEGDGWQVRVLGVHRGRYALSVRRAAPGRFYPNEVVEKALGVRGTTRGWETMVALAEALEG